jgi:hypothetical protein
MSWLFLFREFSAMLHAVMYCGRRTSKGVEVCRDGEAFDPRPSQRIWNHSPDGFEWGYGGSGPAQLALALLADVLSPGLAEALHQRFKWEVVSRFDHDGWQITPSIILEWAASYLHNAEAVAMKDRG